MVDFALGEGAFTQAILDALPDHVAILDADGTILAVNAAWREFARQNGDPQTQHTDVGTNYFAVCRRASAPESVEALSTLEGMRAVLQGDLAEFQLEYPCHSPDRERWFLLHVTPIRAAAHSAPSGLLVRHIDITERVVSARKAWQARTQQEIDSVAQLNSPSAPVTGQLFGAQALYQSQPRLFERLSAEYRALLDQAVAQRPFGEWRERSEALRRLAAQLGTLRVVPRDIIELHVRTMRAIMDDESNLKAEVYAEEGRLAVLELMGYLASFYRTYALGILRTAPPNPLRED